MSVEIPEKFNDMLEKSEFCWFTTVRADGMPQPTPVWFVRDGDSLLIYTEPTSQKVRNIRANPKVALSVANEDAGDYVVVQGAARIDPSIPPADRMPAYFQKYQDLIAEIGYTPESFVAQWSLPIRVTPLHVHGLLS